MTPKCEAYPDCGCVPDAYCSQARNKYQSAEAQRENFLRIVSQIPPTWTCIDCKGEMDNTPDSRHPPFAVVLDMTTRQRLGEICETCYHNGGRGR